MQDTVFCTGLLHHFLSRWNQDYTKGSLTAPNCSHLNLNFKAPLCWGLTTKLTSLFIPGVKSDQVERVLCAEHFTSSPDLPEAPTPVTQRSDWCSGLELLQHSVTDFKFQNMDFWILKIWRSTSSAPDSPLCCQRSCCRNNSLHISLVWWWFYQRPPIPWW